MPKKYRFPLTVKTQNINFVFLMQSREERDILVHEINAVCQVRNHEVQLLSARRCVMPFIDPIVAFNVWNLSIICMPLSVEQSAFDNSTLRRRGDSINEQAQIVRSEPVSADYIRNGARCYVSSTLRKELFITDGLLYKEPKVRRMFFKNDYYATYVTIDFKLQLIRFKKPSLSSTKQTKNTFKGDKDVQFAEMIDCKKLQKGELG